MVAVRSTPVNEKRYNSILKNVNNEFPSSTTAEKKLLTDKIDRAYEFAIGSFDGSREERYLKTAAKEKGIIPAIFSERPGIFWIEESKAAREKIAKFLVDYKLTKLAKDFLDHGKEPNRGSLIIDDPATTRFLEGLTKVLNDRSTKFSSKFADLLRKTL